MPAREPPGKFIGTRRIEKVPGHGAQFGPVQIGLVVHRQRFVPRSFVHAPANVAGGIGQRIVEALKVVAHQRGVSALTGYFGDVICFQSAINGAFEIPFEVRFISPG